MDFFGTSLSKILKDIKKSNPTYLIIGGKTVAYLKNINSKKDALYLPIGDIDHIISFLVNSDFSKYVKKLEKIIIIPDGKELEFRDINKIRLNYETIINIIKSKYFDPALTMFTPIPIAETRDKKSNIGALLNSLNICLSTLNNANSKIIFNDSLLDKNGNVIKDYFNFSEYPNDTGSRKILNQINKEMV